MITNLKLILWVLKRDFSILLLTYFSFKLQEHIKVAVFSKSRMSSQTRQEHLVHGYSFLESSKIFPETKQKQQNEWQDGLLTLTVSL